MTTRGKRKSKKIGRDKKAAIHIAKQLEARLVLGDMGLLERNDESKNPTLRQYVDGWKDGDGQQNLGSR